MQRIIDSRAMGNLEKEAGELVPSSLFRENAAFLLWREVERHAPSLTKQSGILFLCGPGGNGQDALAAARIASSLGYTSVRCVTLGGEGGGGEDERTYLRSFPVPCGEPDDRPFLEEIIIDGLFGVGLNRPLSSVAASLVRRANEARAYRVAIDVPSGLGDSFPLSSCPVFQADLTVTLGLGKLVLYHPYGSRCSGTIVTVNPSFPPDLLRSFPSFVSVVEKEEVKVPPLGRNDYKKSRGHLSLFAGSRRYSGAATLACRAAFHARVGLVTLNVDEDILPTLARANPSAMVRSLSDASLSEGEAILSGPGWGSGREELLIRILETEKPLLLDADAITAYANLWKEGVRKVRRFPLVMTPHLGELSRLSLALLGEDIARGSSAAFHQGLLSLSALSGGVIVAKSALNHIATESDITIIPGFNPSLAAAGSGDVLAALIASFLAQGWGKKEAAIAGCALHQRVGALARRERGYYASSALIPLVGKCLKEMEA